MTELMREKDWNQAVTLRGQGAVGVQADICRNQSEDSVVHDRAEDLHKNALNYEEKSRGLVRKRKLATAATLIQLETTLDTANTADTAD
ncbi:hypothetical protein RvY_06330 [Ramazzottius varieornatus]|uniref:Uncharacterized protein n=1 Tax=Ramazzottius varieornatus TaxID=947166 RepID=A0A1D1V7V8_RAMVA|nr:hypothetical protein RvY_06330 [Ramazzottius varieornatus]